MGECKDGQTRRFCRIHRQIAPYHQAIDVVNDGFPLLANDDIAQSRHGPTQDECRSRMLARGSSDAIGDIRIDDRRYLVFAWIEFVFKRLDDVLTNGVDIRLGAR